MTYPKEFKEALSNLPSKEKDKLILRLLFELVSTKTVEEQRDKLEERLYIL